MRSAAVTAPVCTVKIPPASSTMEARYGAMAVPSELNAWESVRRKCERSGGPSAAASGLAATCRIVMPLAMMNSATNTWAKVPM